MDIGYIWDEEKCEKTREKHGISFDQVVSVMENPNGVEVGETIDGEERWVWISECFNGKILAVVFIDSEEDWPLYRIVTSFEAEGDWLEIYKNREL